MAVQQRRTSKTRKRTRRTHWRLVVSGKVACPHCGEMIEAHIVCPACGYYKGKDILHLKKKDAE